jgi:hypothetical protein
MARIANTHMKKMPLATMTSIRLKAVRESRERGRVMRDLSTLGSAAAEDA